jgi:hypothetical protein
VIKTRACINAAALAVSATIGVAAKADPVVYTLRTVADGQLGGRTFYEALVTIRMRGDTRDVQQQPGSNGAFIYTISQGIATVTVESDHDRTIATFAPGEVYVRYDTYSGVAGFGSTISPTYPIALGCADFVASPPTQDCLQGDWTTDALANLSYEGMHNGTGEALAEATYIPGDAVNASDAVFGLPTNLTQSTLVTGRAHTCATTYTLVYGNDLSVCSGPAPRGLVTNKGDFYLQDVYGINFGTFANTGALQVEVFPPRDD